MNKPNDYNIYFNSDGTPKQNPHLYADGRAMPDVEVDSVAWGCRQFDIKYALMSAAEKADYHARTDNMRAKMA